jgi:hypothetical protein
MNDQITEKFISFSVDFWWIFLTLGWIFCVYWVFCFLALLYLLHYAKYAPPHHNGDRRKIIIELFTLPYTAGKYILAQILGYRTRR